MHEFLQQYNQTPTIETFDQLWITAAEHDLHNAVVSFGKLSLAERERLDIPLVPDSQELLHRLGVSSYFTGDPADLELGRWATDQLCMASAADPKLRAAARINQVFYIKNLKDLAPDTQYRKFRYPDIRWNPMNPSIVQWRNQLWMIQRTVNYNILPDGSYDTGTTIPICTKNYLVQLDYSYNVIQYWPIDNPINWPAPKYPMILGFEDCRPFVWNDQLHCSATVREQHDRGICQMIMLTIDGVGTDQIRFTNPQWLRGPDDSVHQKNWMPMTPTVRPTWVFAVDPTVIINDQGRVLSAKQNPIDARNFRGGGQVVIFDDSLLCIVHESVVMPDGLRSYVHRFVTLNRKLEISAVSQRFKFVNSRIEFAAGLTTHPISNDIIVSFGVDDCASWVCTISQQQIRNMLESVA